MQRVRAFQEFVRERRMRTQHGADWERHQGDGSSFAMIVLRRELRRFQRRPTRSRSLTAMTVACSAWAWMARAYSDWSRTAITACICTSICVGKGAAQFWGERGQAQGRHIRERDGGWGEARSQRVDKVIMRSHSLRREV